ncbi:rod shape-determining protein [Streptomyces sp. NPDC005438]|uniref:rod shape-determining protein n=1 Tax=Streptomyces sp. NPDC005438 TaxID=3156880 RepID=UPI0033BB3A4C
MSHEPQSLTQVRRCSLAVDLGAARTRVYLKSGGLIVDAPSVVAVDARTGGLIAAGTRAARMEGRTPDYIRVQHPVVGGTVTDVATAQRMLRALIGTKLRRAWHRRPLLRAAVCVPNEAEPVARRAAVDTLAGIGARHVELVETPIAAGVGCGLPVEQPEATMILVCGATSTQVAVVALGAVVAAERVPMGGDTVHAAVRQHLRNRYELVLPSQSVMPLELSLYGSAGDHLTDMEIDGRDVVTGRVRRVRVDAEEMRQAARAPLTALMDAVRAVLLRCPPDLVADLAERGMNLVGGSAQLAGLESGLRQHTGMPVRVAEEPSLCPVRGLAALIEGQVRPMGLEPVPS